jgi:hypothetical protein
VSGSEERSFLEPAVRFTLVALAFVILWRVEEPTLLEIPTIQIGAVEPERGPVLPALLAGVSGLAAGLLFGLAGRPLSGWRYRPGLPVLLGLIPASIVAVQLLVFSRLLPLSNEGVFGRIGYFFVADFPLRISAILLGVALAQGVVEADEQVGQEEW